MNRRKYRGLAFVWGWACVLVAACGPHRGYAPYDTVQTMEGDRYDVTELPAYGVQVGDRLSVKFTRNPELDQEVIVRPDGRISLPFIDEVQSAGLTPQALQKEIARRYAGELALPEVTVIVTQFGGNRVFVDGEVAKPGVVDLSGGMTLLNAISSAGGFTPGGLREQVILIRRDPDGKPVGHAVDMKQVVYGQKSDADVLLQPFDVVYVPRSKIANAGVWVEQYIRDMLPIRLRIAIPLALWL